MMVLRVFTELTGGLGNQMFQYAAGRSLSLRHGAELLFDTRGLSRDPLRSYALDAMRVAGRIASRSELPMPWGRVTRRAPWLSGILGGPRLIAERAFEFDPTLLEIKPPVALHGNWQSERYFADHAATIRADFSLAYPLSATRADLAQKISAAKSPVSVHVRRGDYVSNPVASAYHGTCKPDWYKAVKQMFETRVAAPDYFVFSDDPDWTRRNVRDFMGATFIAPADDGQDAHDLHLMSLCHHHIIANSSFSWWGAWLNPRPDKIVIAPERWFAGAGHDTRDLIPATWLRL